MQFHDKELGIITARYNSRAKRVIARFQDGQFIITLPSGINTKQATKIIDEMRPQLVTLKKSQTTMMIKDGTVINSATAKVKIQVSDATDSYKYNKVINGEIIVEEDEVIIYVSPKTDLKAPEVQSKLNYMINNVIYQEAQRFLIPKTIEYAEHFNLYISDVKISKSKGRWGSCSSKKSINLSYYLMMLPMPLINYVILHELAHTIEMNHSDRFWSLLDKMCGEDSRHLGSIARSYSTQELELVRSY